MVIISVIGCIAAVIAATFSGINVYRSLMGNKPFVHMDYFGSVYAYNSNIYPIVIEKVFVTGCVMKEIDGTNADFEAIYRDSSQKNKNCNAIIKANSESSTLFIVNRESAKQIRLLVHRKTLFSKDNFSIEARSV